MADEKQLKKALRSSIKNQESMLRLLRKIVSESDRPVPISLRFLLNFYTKRLEKLKRISL